MTCSFPLIRSSALLMALVLAGCGGADPVHFEQEGGTFAEAPAVNSSFRLRKLWETRPGGGYDPENRPLEVSVDGDRVYLADPNGTVMAVDGTSGSRFWVRDLDEDVVAGVSHGDGVVVMGTSEGEVVALSDANGDELWRTSVSGDISARPIVGPGHVVVRTADGQMMGLESGNGNIVWRVRRPVPALSVHGDSEPLIQGEAMVSGMANGKLMASEIATGRVLWEVPIANPSGRNEIEQMTDIDADPVLVGTILYVAAFQGSFSAMALGSPNVLWSRQISTLRTIGFDEDRVYVTDEDGVVRALNRFTGETDWSQRNLRGRGVSGALALNDHLVVGDYEGYVYLMDKQTGDLVGKQKTGNKAIMLAPVREDSRVYMVFENGTVSAWDAQPEGS